ncbi:U3 small nucleolar RNA-associated protein 14 homolog A [Pelmatolapia mariae]|uniref:U3 small nucleolar RNA-associated protein 14 homolog A n=1 Tax=Pelmatolapia mariae TaxID=158779 RepID=UPI002FE57390
MQSSQFSALSSGGCCFSMAKVSKKKASKKKTRSGGAEQSNEGHPDVIYDDEKEEDATDEDITVEDEDGYDERKRQKLLEAIGTLSGKRKKTLGERSEAAVHMSEFTVNAEGEGDKVDLSDLIGSMKTTPGLSGKSKKRLKNLEQSRKTIECPLSKQESERIRRDLAFQKVSKEVSHWKSVIRQNERAEQLVFPLNQEHSGPKPIERVVMDWKAQTPLEQEVFTLLSANKQPINDPILTPTEEASMKAMSLEEAKVRRAELQKARALQSYYEAKARRQKKIKSKKYHKVLNKAKSKDFQKQFDEMVKRDPAAALEELNKMEMARMQERMSLKHQNSSKWARSKAIMAKYDEGARKAIQQQLEVNKDLTQKLVTSLNKEEEETMEEEGNADVVPDFVNDAEEGLDFSNPWMTGKLSQDCVEKETSNAVTIRAEENVAEEEEVEETEEEVLLREFDSRRKRRQAQEADAAVMLMEEEEEEEENKDASDKEEEELSEFTSLFKGIAERCGEADTAAELEKELKIRCQEDEELLTQGKEAEEEEATDKGPVVPQHPPATENGQKTGKSRKRRKGIELKQVLTKGAQVLQVSFAPTIEDAEDSEEKLDQRGLIKEAFAGDDIISDFLKEKRKQEDAGKPKVVDLTLPGWGEWGGGGLQPSCRKRRKFRRKMTPPTPRKDKHLPGVIISEKRSSSIRLHQVNALPFPFESPSVFENTIRSALGRTWNTEHTVKKVTKPKVVTKLGAIIEPMTREELVKDKNGASAGSSSSVKRKP